MDLCHPRVCQYVYPFINMLKTNKADIQNGYGVHIWDLYLVKLKPFKQVPCSTPYSPERS
jgi:hypothetical protein